MKHTHTAFLARAILKAAVQASVLGIDINFVCVMLIPFDDGARARGV